MEIKSIHSDENDTVYIFYCKSQGAHDIRIRLDEDVVHTLDPKFISGIEISGLPEVTTSDNNKVMTVVNGEWVAQTPASGLPEVTSNAAPPPTTGH